MDEEMNIEDLVSKNDRVESLQASAKCIMYEGSIKLLQHLEHTVSETLDGIKFAGTVFSYNEGDDGESIARARYTKLTQLLEAVDRALVVGDESKDPREFNGLLHTEGVEQTSNSRQFYQWVKEQRDAGMNITVVRFDPPTMFLDEGSPP